MAGDFRGKNRVKRGGNRKREVLDLADLILPLDARFDESASIERIACTLRSFERHRMIVTGLPLS